MAFLPILFGFLLMLNCVPQASGNYFDRIATVSNGRLTRFTNLPITVYVEGMEVQGEKYVDDLRYALKEWEDCSSGMIKFELVGSPDGADILVSWVNRLEAGFRDHPLGVAELHRIDRNKIQVEMYISIREVVTGQPLTNEQMKVVLLHEFGHAVGLWGHSKDKADVMYFAADVSKPTANDIETIRIVYSHENNYPLHEQSISAIRGDIESNPEDGNLYFLLGTIYMDQEDHGMAIENFKRCLSLDPGSYRARIALASAYRAIGQDQSALAEYLSLIESNPSAMMHNLVGISYFENGDALRAIDHFKKALEIDRIYEPAKRNLYRVYLNKGKELSDKKMYYAAIEVLSDGIRVFPNKPELYNNLGIAYAEAGRLQEALEQYDKALQVNPFFTPARNNKASCYNNLGVKYAEAGLWEDAIKAYNQALSLAPDMAKAKSNLSVLYWNWAVELSKTGKNEEAVEVYRQLLELEPDNKEACNNLGATYSRLGKYREAVAELETALKLDPTSQDIKSNLAIVHQRWGMELLENKSYDQSVAELKKALNYMPNNVDIYISLAIAYQRLAKWDDATKQINVALSLSPDNMDAKKMLANLEIDQGNRYLQSKKYDRALEHYLKVPAELMSPSLHNSISYVYIMKDMYKEAADELDKVLKAYPEDRIANQNLNNIESRLSRSFSRDRSSQRLRDELARVRLSMAMAYAGRGDLDRAKKVLRSTLVLKPEDKALRQLLVDGYMRLAEMFTKKGIQEEADEIMKWTAQLKDEG